MKNVSRVSMAVGLSLLLTASTFAGEIHIGKAPPPPPDPSASAASVDIATPGEIQIPRTPSDSAMEVALNLLQNLLSVF